MRADFRTTVPFNVCELDDPPAALFHPIEDAVKEGGRVRMRPILMTAFTTVFGLLPLALQIGEGSEFWSPLGRAVIGGMIVSTFLTLIFIPVLYTSFEKGAEKRRLRKQARIENQQPA